MKGDGRHRMEATFTPVAGRSDLLVLASLLGRAAGAHARILGLGLDHLAAQNLTWMLSRLLVRAVRMPQAGEALVVTTWPSGVARFLALREFLVENRDGAELARGTSAWFLIDFAARRPVSPEPHIGQLCVHERLIDSLERIDDPPGSDWRRSFDVAPTDIDRNRHVTFSSYIRWVEEALRQLGHTGPVLELEINYLAEVFEGERVSVLGGAERCAGRPVLAAVVREKDGSVAAKARLRFGDS